VTDPVDWALAARVAGRIAGSDEFSRSYHAHSLRPDFEELTAQAEELVAAETGLRSLAGPARARVASRQDWVVANVASFQRLLKPITERLGPKMTGPFAPAARAFAGAEVGALLGWMSKRVLGQYDLLVSPDDKPEEQDLVYYVGSNVLALEKRYAFPPREFRLWLALHEVTHRAQFTGVPWMRQHYLGLVETTLGAADADPTRFLAAIRRATADVRAGRNPLDDGGIVGLLANPEQRAALDGVGGLMSLLEGHGDVTMDRAGGDRVPSAARFSRVLNQRRGEATGLNKAIRQALGIEAKMRQYEQGERFIADVERRRGKEYLDLVWGSPDRLPTLAEIRDPALWTTRIDQLALAR
jgi:coenzyme F420 biosynthesis associated uncharacterized protein